MMIKKIIPSIFVLATILGLSGCMTDAVMEARGCHIVNGCSDTYSKKHTIFEDTYIAIGKPTKPIAGFDNALVLIGKNSTLILTPKRPDDVQFFQNFHKLDLNYLSLSTYNMYYGRSVNGAETVEVKDGGLNNLSSSAIIRFARKSDFPATASEKQLLNELGFELASNDNSYRSDGVYFEYDRWVYFNITVAQAIPNIHLQHTFRKPVSFEFVTYEEKKRKFQPVLKALMLPAIAFDIITLPIQLFVEYGLD